MKSIRLRLILVFTAVIFVVTAGLGLTSVKMISDRLLQNAFEDLQALAEAEAKYVRSVRDTELRYLEGIARSPFVRNEEIFSIERTAYFQKEAQKTGYSNFMLADVHGSARSMDRLLEAHVADEPFFIEALAGQAVVSDVLINPQTGGAEMVFAVPVRENNEIVGVFFGTKDGMLISEIINQTQYRSTGYAFILNYEGATVAHGDSNRVLTRDNAIINARTNPALQDLADLMQGQILSGQPGSASYFYEGVERLVGFAPIEGTPWVLVTAVEAAEIMSEIALPRNILAGIVLAALLIGGLAVFVLSSSVAKPIQSLTPLLEQIAGLNLAFDESHHAVRYLKRKDEIGQAMRALASMQADLAKVIEEISAVADEVAEMSENLSAASQENSATIEEVASTAGAFSQNVDRTSNQAKDMGAEAEAIEVLAGDGLERMGASMAAMESIQRGSGEVQTAISELSEQTKNMEAVLRLIADIADQTNLLALNAAIEAARAGEHGRGFAVVADEVRKLAEETQHSVAEISQMINGLVQNAAHSAQTMSATNEQIERGTQLLEETQTGLTNITDKITITGRMILEMVSAVNEMNEGSGSIAAATEEQAASMEQIASTTQVLAQASDNLRSIVTRFTL